MEDTMLGSETQDIREGNSCLLEVLDEHFMVEINKVQEDSFSVTFPAVDYPIEGMTVTLEFHDSVGFNRYRAKVLRGPSESRRDIVLQRPTQRSRASHRQSYRIPTDLTAQIRDEAHVRRYDAEVLDLSRGGTLLRTEAPLGFESMVEVTLSLPGEPTHRVTGQVVHFSESDDSRGPSHRLLGVRFVALDGTAEDSISRYVTRRMRDLHTMR